MIQRRKAYIIKVDGTKTELDHRPSLAEAQSIVCGYIEHVPLKGYTKDKVKHPACTMIVNDSGLLLGLPVNEIATSIYRQHIRWMTDSVVIVGDVIVLYGWRTVGE